MSALGGTADIPSVRFDPLLTQSGQTGCLILEFNDGAAAASARRRRVRLSDDETVRLCERHHHRTVLDREGRGDLSGGAVAEAASQIVLALAIGGEVAPEHRRFDWDRQVCAPAHAAD